MLFPKNRMRFTTNYQGKTDPNGWIVLDLAGVDITEDHERAAVSMVLISEKGSLLTHWIRVSSIDNTEKNCQEDVVKVDRAIQRSKRHR